MKNKVILFLVFTFSFSPIVTGQNLEIGDKIVDFRGYDVKSKRYIRLSQFKKKKNVLLNFTATYCGSCWKTYPHMQELQKKYASKLKVVSVHGDEKKVKWYEIAKRLKIDFKCTTMWKVEGKEKIKKVYGVDKYPTFFAIDKNGIIIDKWVGNQEKRMKTVIKKMVSL
ncbi:Thiol-disulfide isomerase or thioredoxin [Tenacibaculum sp. MAR_2009_124]|uniref:TlpA family protein disulfide reductase n=1 Tax=Tenacibaculum sp. MAR_2009_124 TaxID=1250059 RepID=UPI00089DA274|nr:thioredoxin-like domain-containing protein [Tenacibaculum sp. MAR_2009_124]SEB84951.1 Thiol-disulfide isomerase or thioredoxin [Tenacibaculum sp. MAR_2009_124]